MVLGKSKKKRAQPSEVTGLRPSFGPVVCAAASLCAFVLHCADSPGALALAVQAGGTAVIIRGDRFGDSKKELLGLFSSSFLSLPCLLAPWP
jgi:hypothetical protein